jgi:hypothetical protein
VEGAYFGLFPNWTGHGSLLSADRASLGQRFSLLLLGKEDVGSTQHKVSWSTAGALRRAYEWSSIEIFTNVDQLHSFVFELLQSLLGERSENVVRSHAKRGEVHGEERECAPQSSYLAIRGVGAWAFRSITLARTTIAPGEKKLAAPCSC